jgi:hypothetical protein
MNCNFSEPINLGTEATPDWEFSQITCEDNSTSTISLIETPNGNFWLNKSWTFGELFISFLLVGFLFFWISKSIWGFFYPQLIKFKK